MRSPEGQDHWTKGKYTEITPHTRLVIDMTVVGDKDMSLCRVYTVVTFEVDGTGTRMEVTQSYTPLHPSATRMIQGAPQGWKETLDRLEHELA